MKTLADMIKQQLESNKGKISKEFIDKLAENVECQYWHLTDRTRICVLTLYDGHEVVGIAQVLDPANDVAEIGKKVAFDNAKNQLWSVCGNIALVV